MKNENAAEPGPSHVPVYDVRSKRVVLDADLAGLYGVSTKQLNQQVRRNPKRFPADFAFQLTNAEWALLRSEIGTSKNGRGTHRKFLPTAFTEYGALMAAGVLNSDRAFEVSVYVVRAFVAMREAALNTHELAGRLRELETKLEQRLEKQDEAIAEIFRAIRALMAPPEPPRRTIGFVQDSGGSTPRSRRKPFVGSDPRAGDVARHSKRLLRRPRGGKG